MLTKDTVTRLSNTTVILHWLVGLTMISLLAVGVYMAETKTYWLYSWHKSFGIAIFAVILLRVIWRLINGWPTPVNNYKRVEQLAAKAVHWLLIVGTLLMPLSGFLMSAIGGHSVELFGLELVARNVNPDNPQKSMPHNDALAGVFKGIHHWLGWALVVAIVLHISGALKHHFVDRDGTMRRMLGKAVDAQK